jgi:anthranilate phosphoribosyltransferase
VGRRKDTKLASERPKYPKKYSWWSSIIEKAVSGDGLSYNDVMMATTKILKMIEKKDDAVPVLMASFFGSLTAKDPTIDEFAAMNSAMEATKRVQLNLLLKKPVVAAGGTGGDTLKTINVTTPAVLLAASAGAFAVKSGAKAFSSKTGATDLAITMGINVDAPPHVVKDCVERIRTAVWDSGNVYPWMESLVDLRNYPSAPIFFPLMGSLRLMIATSLNPFSTKRQVRGISIPQTQLIAEVFSRIGYERALVPLGYGENESIRIDEFSTLGKTIVSELFSNGKVETYSVSHQDLGARKGDAKEIIARDTHLENAKVVLNVLSGKDRSSRKDLIIVNAAAILYLGDVTNSFKEGYEIASNSIENGEAIKKVEELVKCSCGDLKSFRNLLR